MKSFIYRIGFFLVLNFVLLMTFSAILYFLPIQPGYYGRMLILYSLFGFGGAFISLFLSRKMAKWQMGVKVIDPRNTRSETEKWLLNTVHDYARKARLPKMPEVGIYGGQEPNAFATGPSKSRSLVAVSEGLLRTMNKEEVEGVLAHEVAHIQNGDMVTMVLLSGVINTLVMFASRILADLVASKMSRDNRGGGFLRFGLYMAFSMVLGLLGMVVTGAFSRMREFRADSGAAKLAGRDKMIMALKRLQSNYNPNPNQRGAQKAPESIAALRISGNSGISFKKLISTHPPLQDRIRRLETGR